METLLNITYEEAILKVLGNMPIVFNADIGHVNPKMTFANGAVIDIKSFDKKGIVEFKLK